MDKYDTVNFNKNDIIIKSGENPPKYFYILMDGKATSYYDFYKEYKHKNVKGSIIGLISAIIEEPYFSTVEVEETSELIKINIESIINIKDENLLIKMYNYLYFILETWLSKYYTILAVNKVDLYNKDDTITMANIYKNNGYIDASYKLCLKYIELFPESNDITKVKKFINDIENIKYTKELEHIENNIYKFPKGYCIYTEIYSSDNIYIIQSGKVGIYSIVNSKQIVRNIYTDGYIINGYNPTLEYQPLLTTAIVLEDSIINIMTKNQLIDMIYNNKSLRINFIKMVAIKVNNAVLKVKAMKKDELSTKLIIIIYSVLKMETLYNKDITKLTLLYTIEDIKNMLNIDADNKEICNELKNIQYVELDSNSNIKITNIENYFKKYKNYII
ncbi:cyclic nucleotide-binding domain-containing protein [Brachyspira hyodysenteriae]|uniref:cAMP-binding protein n=2 Tax=Brachyspira hyodysenteriae TaxID=159 RepID=A0A3B6VD80_BRAHW|nr:cyclic nucleotide-binding domain-containing protein [Brachyspira hyodysenteriae]ACN82744.1 cAMP-binding protein [Brachyspira hyodysenteriae WA1]ANN62628.1 Crp/Fnr family transcriptional regulator [Brachyspira hyodysenteriae ATCC 27164]AUJ48495.1 Crp/Fnr family transcriptional regulator [Brachyspira hyodysenteriae]KLI13109.1 Crp/Fnr family transcriptional regulator [Brachyspira hyodysenteriae]KLI15348.1 Crp/Fnr family transcriptional regulator [Brachyspira hyodysenteriae]